MFVQYILFLLITSLSLIAQTQNVEIFINNPQPRINQEFELIINVEHLAKFVDDILPSEIIPKGKFTRDQYTRVLEAKDTGSITIGPINFTFNDENYTSNKIEFNVIGKLKMEEGIWLRHILHDKKEYVIIEQRIFSDGLKVYNSETMKMEWDSNARYASFKQNIGRDIRLVEKYSNRKVESKMGNSVFNYAITVYEVEKNDYFSGKFILKKKHLNDLPRKTELTPIIIKKNFTI